MAVIYNDGTVQYGSQVLVIPKTTGSNYVADDIEITQPTNVIERTDELGEPSGQVLVAGFVTGTATLQLATGITPPDLGDLLTIATVDYIVSEVGATEVKDGEKKCRISFRKKVSA